MNFSTIILIGLAALAITCTSSEDIKSESIVIHGVDVTKLSNTELQTFCGALDEELAGQIDLHVFKRILAEKHNRRQKRFILTAFVIFFGKALVKSAVVSKVATMGKLGAGAAKVYTTYDTVDTAKDVYDTFNSLRPDNVETRVIESGHNRGERIITGEIGDIKVTARSYGPSGLPTFNLHFL